MGAMSRTGMDVESKAVREATGTAKALVKGWPSSTSSPRPGRGA